jgi:hypothetical protein
MKCMTDPAASQPASIGLSRYMPSLPDSQAGHVNVARMQQRRDRARKAERSKMNA